MNRVGLPACVIVLALDVAGYGHITGASGWQCDVNLTMDNRTGVRPSGSGATTQQEALDAALAGASALTAAPIPSLRFKVPLPAPATARPEPSRRLPVRHGSTNRKGAAIALIQAIRAPLSQGRIARTSKGSSPSPPIAGPSLHPPLLLAASHARS